MAAEDIKDTSAEFENKGKGKAVDPAPDAMDEDDSSEEEEEQARSFLEN